MFTFVRLTNDFDEVCVEILDGALIDMNDAFLEIQNEDGIPIALFKPNSWAYVYIKSEQKEEVKFNMDIDATQFIPKMREYGDQQ